MMDYIKEHKVGISIVLIIIVAFVIYTMFFTGGDEDELITSEAANEAAAVGSDLLSILEDLKTIRLDQEIFRDSTFRSLVDFSVVLTPKPVGRENPFAPLR